MENIKREIEAAKKLEDMLRGDNQTFVISQLVRCCATIRYISIISISFPMLLDVDDEAVGLHDSSNFLYPHLCSFKCAFVESMHFCINFSPRFVFQKRRISLHRITGSVK